MRWFDKAPFDQQRIGLELLWPSVKGKTVLDVGCAEGAISKACLHNGAKSVHGVDNRKDAIQEAAESVAGEFWVADVDVWEPVGSYDIVLMLGVLHKLKDPESALARCLNACDGMAVIRLPQGQWPVLRDSRSGNEPQHLGALAESFGFKLAHTAEGPASQWVGYLSR